MSNNRIKRTKLLRFIHYMSQNGLCYYCKKPMKWTVGETSNPSCTLEHLVDVKYGGKTSVENTAAAHFKCNSIKKARRH